MLKKQYNPLPNGETLPQQHENGFVRRDTVVYDEGFRTPETLVSDAEEATPVDEAPQEEPKEKTKKAALPLVVSIRLVLCLIIALAVFLLKASGSELFDAFEKWFDSEMKKTLISQDAFDQTPLSLRFSSTQDTAETTAKK